MSARLSRTLSVIAAATLLAAGCSSSGGSSSGGSPASAPSATQPPSAAFAPAKVAAMVTSPCLGMAASEWTGLLGYKVVPAGTAKRPINVGGAVATLDFCGWTPTGDINAATGGGIGMADFKSANVDLSITATMSRLVSKGYVDVSSQFPVPAAYSQRLSSVALLFDPHHDLIVIGNFKSESSALAAAKAVFAHLK